MIVKVQLSLETTSDKPQILAYNKDRSVMWQGDATPEIIEHLNNAKSYFEAEVIGTEIVLNKEVEEQDW